MDASHVLSENDRALTAGENTKTFVRDLRNLLTLGLRGIGNKKPCDERSIEECTSNVKSSQECKVKLAGSELICVFHDELFQEYFTIICSLTNKKLFKDDIHRLVKSLGFTPEDIRISLTKKIGWSDLTEDEICYFVSKQLGYDFIWSLGSQPEKFEYLIEKLSVENRLDVDVLKKILDKVKESAEKGLDKDEIFDKLIAEHKSYPLLRYIKYALLIILIIGLVVGIAYTNTQNKHRTNIEDNDVKSLHSKSYSQFSNVPIEQWLSPDSIHITKDYSVGAGGVGVVQNICYRNICDKYVMKSVHMKNKWMGTDPIDLFKDFENEIKFHNLPEAKQMYDEHITIPLIEWNYDESKQIGYLVYKKLDRSLLSYFSTREDIENKLPKLIDNAVNKVIRMNSLGIRQNDMHLSNVMVDLNGETFIIDFGKFEKVDNALKKEYEKITLDSIKSGNVDDEISEAAELYNNAQRHKEDMINSLNQIEKSRKLLRKGGKKKIIKRKEVSLFSYDVRHTACKKIRRKSVTTKRKTKAIKRTTIKR